MIVTIIPSRKEIAATLKVQKALDAMDEYFLFTQKAQIMSLVFTQ